METPPTFPGAPSPSEDSPPPPRPNPLGSPKLGRGGAQWVPGYTQTSPSRALTLLRAPPGTLEPIMGPCNASMVGPSDPSRDP